MEPFVSLKNVQKIYRMGEVEIRAVDGMDFDIWKGEFVCRIPTEAEELWMMPVTTAPVRMPRMGLFPSTEKAVEKIGALLYGAMAPDM